MDEQSASSQTARVFAGFRSHNTNTRTSTELVLLESIRSAYPLHDVAITSPQLVDLHGFAAAGHASMISGNDTLYDATRIYKPPPNRLSNLPGNLEDHIRFGNFTYVFKDHCFVVFEIEYQDPQVIFRPPVRLFFIVSPKVSEKDTKVLESSNLDDLLLTAGSWSSNLHSEIYVFDSGQWTKDKILYNSVQTSQFSSVILSPPLKKSLMNDVATFFSSRNTYTRLAVPWKRGLLFHGLPGNGKTISIRAIINMLSGLDDPVPSLVVKAFDSLQGPKFSIREIFQKARSMAPCLLVFEDLDSLITDKTRSYFLNEVDGLECNDGILMIGTTNHLETLDPAISKRPSRFDRKYHFKLPNEEERVLYCEFWKSKLNLDGNEDEEVKFDNELCGIIAKMTEGFSFAYMKELFVISLLIIARGEGLEAGDISEDGNIALVAKEKSIVDSSPINGNAVVAPHPSVSVPVSDPAPLGTNSSPKDLSNADDNKSRDVQTEKPKESKTKRTVPNVIIPDHLKDNLLLKVLKIQCKTLLEEMDNTDEDEWAGSSSRAGKKEDGGLGLKFPFLPKLGSGGDCC
jgi:transitional endoplasmic reticulum ATPase